MAFIAMLPLQYFTLSLLDFCTERVQRAHRINISSSQLQQITLLTTKAATPSQLQ